MIGITIDQASDRRLRAVFNRMKLVGDMRYVRQPDYSANQGMSHSRPTFQTCTPSSPSWVAGSRTAAARSLTKRRRRSRAPTGAPFAVSVATSIATLPQGCSRRRGSGPASGAVVRAHVASTHAITPGRRMCLLATRVASGARSVVLAGRFEVGQGSNRLRQLEAERRPRQLAS